MNTQSTLQCSKKMASLLSKQAIEIQGFIEFFENVRNAIASNQLEALNTLLAQQQPLLEQITNLEAQRHQLLAAYGFDLTPEGLDNCISNCDTDGNLENLYQTFQRALLDLHRSVQVNNLLIDKNKKRIHKSLKLLTGQQNSDSSKTYASNGLTSGLNNKRSIAQA